MAVLKHFKIKSYIVEATTENQPYSPGGDSDALRITFWLWSESFRSFFFRIKSVKLILKSFKSNFLALYQIFE